MSEKVTVALTEEQYSRLWELASAVSELAFLCKSVEGPGRVEMPGRLLDLIASKMLDVHEEIKHRFSERYQEKD